MGMRCDADGNTDADADAMQMGRNGDADEGGDGGVSGAGVVFLIFIGRVLWYFEYILKSTYQRGGVYEFAQLVL